MSALKVADAQNITKGAGVKVAVVDTGTYPHPDLKGNLLTGKTFVSGESGNGQNDRAGHGTEMAALVAAHGRGENGVLGLAPSAKIIPIKISNSKNVAPANEMAEGMNWAIAQGAGVISISAAIGPSFKVQDATAKAMDENIVVVASVGNSSTSTIVGFPAAMDGVLAVGSVGRNGKYSSTSLKTAKVTICAPGIDITTAEPKTRYADIGGTSPATAIVSGAAALVRAKFPRLSAEEVVHRLTATADDIGPPGRDNECGFGRLNLIKALTADVIPLNAGASTAPTPAVPTAAATSPVATSAAVRTAQKEDSEGGSGRGLLYGGIAAVVGLGGVLGFVLLRRRREGV
ncbi:S8 family serine peptidase [Actinoplanes sp. NPDC048988]|uniref:S8 family serine peptidase n=1 Tax=Actinoplanes sp. NPDC048988 TaxID=3363901 RepID=UPI003714A4F7